MSTPVWNDEPAAVADAWITEKRATGCCRSNGSSGQGYGEPSVTNESR